MNLRLFCALVLVAMAGCGGTNAPSSVADSPSPASDVTVDPATDTAHATDTARSTENTPSTGTAPVSQPSSPSSPDASGDLENPAPAATLESLTASMQQSIQGQHFAEALTFAEQALKLEPDNASLLFMATQLAQHEGMQQAQSGADRKLANELFFKSANFVRSLQNLEDELPAPQLQYLSQVFYNEACAHATNGETQKALSSLGDAFDAGFAEFEMVESDADLAELRNTPEFTELVASRREEHQQRRLAEVQEQIDAQEPFDFDFELVSTAGKPVKLADYKGKVLIVDFWGTWCPPCRKEIPHFVELLNNHRSAGLEIVGINYERGDASAATELINSFAKQNDMNYPCLIGDDVTKNRVPNLSGFPTTLFIDRTGAVRLQVVGYHPYDHLEAIVQTLLSEPAGTTGG